MNRPPGRRQPCTLGQGVVKLTHPAAIIKPTLSWLDVHFIHTLPVRGVPGGLGHSRVGGNPGGARQGCWMPAYAGMTFSSP